MKIEIVDINSLIPDPSNARLHGCKKCGNKISATAKFCSRQCRRDWHSSYEAFKTKILNSVTEDKLTGCWNWSKSVGWHGYGKFGMNGKHWRAHRLSYEVFNGKKIADGNLILHSCDNPKCVNPAHLSEGSHLQNSADAKSRGRLKINRDIRLGSKNIFSKLDEIKVAEIKKYLSCGASGVYLASRYQISRSVISEIKNGKLWSHVNAAN